VAISGAPEKERRKFRETRRLGEASREVSKPHAGIRIAEAAR